MAGAGFVRIPDFRLLLLDIRKANLKINFYPCRHKPAFGNRKSIFGGTGVHSFVYCFNSSYCFNDVIGDFGSFPK